MTIPSKALVLGPILAALIAASFYPEMTKTGNAIVSDREKKCSDFCNNPLQFWADTG